MLAKRITRGRKCAIAAGTISKPIPLATWRSLQCELLWVYRGLVPRKRNWSAEIHVPLGVFFVERGKARIRSSGKSIDVPSGHAFFSAPGSRRQWFAAGTRLLSAGFRAVWPDGAPLFAEALNIAVPNGEIAALHEATFALLREVHQREEIVYRAAIAAPALSLQDHACREAAFRVWFAAYVETLASCGVDPAQRRVIHDPRVQTVLKRLDGWPLSRPLDRGELFADLPVGARRMEQLFAEELQLAPSAYFERRRAATARERLSGTDVSLKETAHDLGFRHASHFTLWFRRQTGQTPSSYRQRYREGLA